MLDQLLKIKNVSLSFNDGAIQLKQRFDPDTGEKLYHVFERNKGGAKSRFADADVNKAAQAFVNLATVGSVDGSTPAPATPAPAKPSATAKK